MQNEYFIDYKSLTSESISNYKKAHDEADEITCLVPKDDEQSGELLGQNGFRYIGKRLVEGNIMIVYKWVKGLNGYEDMGAFFDRRAADYDLHMLDCMDSYEKSLANITSSMVSTDRIVHVLDLGCGTGAELKYVFKKVPNAHVVCVDMSDKMLEKLRSNYAEYISNIEIICDSYMGINLGVEKYDYIIACNTLHHLLKEDKLALYRRIKDALKENGLMLISDYIVSDEEEVAIRSKYLRLIEDGTISKDKIYHIDLPLSFSSEKGLLDAAGFADISINRTGKNGIDIIAAK